MPESKATIRKHFLELRSKINIIEAESASLAAARNLIESIDLTNAGKIALYYPVNGEISPLPLISLLKKEGISFCLPVVKAKNEPLEFHSWKPDEKLINNKFYPQLLEPENQKTPIIPDIIIVPLVAFDENRHRIGYGAGFYDRTIQRLGAEILRPLTIGYAFETQKCPPIEAGSHDIHLDFIITDKNIYSA